MTTQDKGKFRTNTKDQFYTHPDVAKRCVKTILETLPWVSENETIWIEPSAGNGAFLQHVPVGVDTIGLDLEPKGVGILRGDYLTWAAPTASGRRTLVFGNPPFGRQSCLAKAFIAKSCKFADAIAFILPKSFTKPSMYKAFGRRFHLMTTVELAKNSFLLNGAAYDVPCVFQIWEKKGVDREEMPAVGPEGFTYVKKEDAYDIAFRRVGGLAGKCYRKGTADFSVQSHYFLKFDSVVEENLEKLITAINAHVFPSNTVGPRSLSKPEVNAVLNEILEGLTAGDS